ncbi:MAG: hypothetical protein Q9162_003221 [Coniocarpon cinnabarinum]
MSTNGTARKSKFWPPRFGQEANHTDCVSTSNSKYSATIGDRISRTIPFQLPARLRHQQRPQEDYPLQARETDRRRPQLHDATLQTLQAASPQRGLQQSLQAMSPQEERREEEA